MKQEAIKSIDRELKDIEREYPTTDWDTMDVDKMDAAAAYNRGYYRALQSVKNMLEEE